MDLSFKPCSSIAATTTGSLREVRNRGDSLLLDRLSSLPIELLIRILSLLPTKDAAATCLLSKKLRRVFPWITSLDFDDSSISYCLSRPSRVERFPSYVTFVDSVLQEYQSQHLTRFRLQVGGHSRPRVSYLPRYNDTKCDLDCAKGCYPHLSSTQIFAWISLPLTRHGLRELDLSIHVSEEGDSQLPPDIFVCEMLELLKLDINLGLDLVSTMPSFKLPNLKLLHLITIFISGDGFVTRLVSSCPLLEDLYVNAGYTHVYSTVIYSPSLRRLHYSVTYFPDEFDNPENMLINTPNLEYFKYVDNLASRYTISKMDSLVIAILDIGNILEWDEREVSFQQLVNLIRPLSNAQHLVLGYASTTPLNFVELKDLLPVFRNLEYLERDGCVGTFWDKMLMAFLHRCPVLKSLVFTRGQQQEQQQQQLEQGSHKIEGRLYIVKLQHEDISYIELQNDMLLEEIETWETPNSGFQNSIYIEKYDPEVVALRQKMQEFLDSKSVMDIASLPVFSRKSDFNKGGYGLGGVAVVGDIPEETASSIMELLRCYLLDHEDIDEESTTGSSFSKEDPLSSHDNSSSSGDEASASN